jgi:hypothetical protein
VRSHGERLGPLAERPFRLLWFGQTTSALGDALMGVALAFAVLDLGGSAGDLGLVFAARTVSSVAFVLAGGVWADRLPRRTVMLVADAVRALVQGLVAFLLVSGAPARSGTSARRPSSRARRPRSSSRRRPGSSPTPSAPSGSSRRTRRCPCPGTRPTSSGQRRPVRSSRSSGRAGSSPSTLPRSL